MFDLVDSAIRTRGLTKYYGRTPGVIDVDLDVPAGLVVGFLGPKGAVAGLVEDLAGAVKLSPIWMYSGTETIVGGLSVGKTSTMAALGVAAIVLAGFFFERRDVRS